ncbi:MAG TPA: hypothetical protein VM223_26035, partial [Planctomycetota bacterium]|nr:hypothetical protein [Planctomycetota bacterium]
MIQHQWCSAKTVMILVAFFALMASASAADAPAGEARQAPANVQAEQQMLVEAEAPPAAPIVALPPGVKIADVSVKGKIEGENITFTLGLTVESKRRGLEIALISGDVVLDTVAEPKEDYRLRYDLRNRTYFIVHERSGGYRVEASFAARPALLDDGSWRESQFSIPASLIRQLEVTCDRSDLEIQFPGALRLTREMKDGTLTITAILGPGRPFAVRWKPQISELDAKLVLTCESNVIATAGVGALRVDTLFAFTISQGKLNDLAFAVPKSLSVTQVRGQHIRDWRLDPEGDAGQKLTVILNKPYTDQYGLQVLAETPLPQLPTDVDLPVISPVTTAALPGGVRTAGHLAVGTNSAIHLLVKKTSSLSQIDASAFARILLDGEHPRPLPAAKAFCYTYASLPYQLAISLSDITPSYDASESLVLNVLEADLTVDAGIDMDIRDAPIRSVIVEIPAGYAVADVSGSDVKKDDFTARPIEGNAALQEVEVHFTKPVQGRTLVRMRMELGKSPLGVEQPFGDFAIRGAKNERGYIAIVAEEGVQLDPPRQQGLRDVHTGSVPMKVANAQYAYRFREKGWSLAMTARKKASGIRVEALHLVSLGEGVAYSAVTANYVISGAPVDRLYFRLPDNVETIEFVGRDVSIWEKDGDQWVVRLQRKVIGDYNLGITYSQRYDDGSDILVGGAQCEQVDTRTGYIAVAGHVNAKLTPKDAPGGNVMEINRDEVPANYRLMVNAPILKTWKYVNAPHNVTLTVNLYEPDQLLPVLIEVSEMNTTLSIRKDGETESVTRIRYKAKNSSSQFLMLSMPKGARVWTTHIIERDAAGAEKPVRVTSSFDEKAGKLMIPLRRYRNPNEPVTVELEYGQGHGTLGWNGAFALTAPCSSVRSTFGNWLVTAPKDWAVVPDPKVQGTMVADDPGLRAVGVIAVANRLLVGWELALARMFDAPEDIILVLIVIAGAIAAMLAITRYVPRLHPAIIIFVLLLVVGIRAAALLDNMTAIQVASDDFRSLRFTQVLNADEQTPLMVSAFAVPAWRRGATLGGSVILPLAGVVCLLLGMAILRRRPTARRALVALGLACFVCAAAQFPAAMPVLLHLLTWGVPAALVLWAGIVALARRGQAPLPSPVVVALLVAALLAAGCSATRPAIAAPQPAIPVLDHVECHLTAEKDSMAMNLHLQFKATGPMRVPLLGTGAILLSPQKISDSVHAAIENGCYRLIVDKKGKYDVELKFLCPLDKAGDDQVRRFRAPIPPALTNRVELSVPETGMQIEAPNAVRLIREETEEASVARAILGPGDDAVFEWKPRARQVKLEATSFYAEVVSLFKLDTGVAEGRHRIRFQIAQGELSEVKVNVPQNMTVTAVDAKGVGAWRFDPASHALEVKLALPAHDDWVLTVITQSSAEGTPYDLSISILTVEKAASQRGTTGVVASPAVYFALKQKPQEMNVDDFVRDAAPLLASMPDVKPADVRFAFRTNAPADVLAVQVSEVQPEIRSQENTTFSIADDRLIYNSDLAIEIAKAGVFSTDLNLPAGYDIDALTAAEVSHWDDTTTNYGRTVQVHFKARIMGQVVIKLAMSRPESELPKDVKVPRVEVAGTMKHSGQIVISSDRGVRMSVAARNGVSELNTLELGIRNQDSLAFKLLKSDWDLTVQTEVIKPRINVDFLHVARVTEGLVRHTHYLMYRLYNAGSKEFQFEVPKDAVGLVVTGPDIARREQVGADGVRPGQAQGPAPTVRWRVELAHKWFDRPYPLRIEYETQFDRSAGEVKLLPAKAITPDMQRGHIVVYATDRVELAKLTAGEMLQPADTRSLPGDFGAGDLSDAAFCYACTAANWELAFKATRHSQAALLEA